MHLNPSPSQATFSAALEAFLNAPATIEPLASVSTLPLRAFGAPEVVEMEPGAHVATQLLTDGTTVQLVACDRVERRRYSDRAHEQRDEVGFNEVGECGRRYDVSNLGRNHMVDVTLERLGACDERLGAIAAVVHVKGPTNPRDLLVALLPELLACC